MSVATSTHLTITSRASDSNKCPLKVSLIGPAQGNPTAIENTDDSIIKMLITDYITQNHKFTIYIVFSHTNPRFEYLKINTQLKDSTIFVVGQMEVINNKFYVNAKDINYFNIKKKFRYTPVIQTPSLTTLSDIESEPPVKRKRSEEIDQLIDVNFTNTNDNYKSETIKANSVKTSQEKPEKPIKNPKSIKNSTSPLIKERPIRTTRGPKKSCHMTVEDAESDKE
ncbi:6880_t:CDS:2 [Gigaspora rosea]|nr:6880_t:CDS:2 [Gigaspora rosea]